MTATRRDELLAFDREHVWHPYTSMTDPTPVRLVDRRVRRTAPAAPTAPSWSTAMSSWWAAIHGYAVPELDAALRRPGSAGWRT